MSNYRRAPVAGATYFFTLALADRRSDLLVSHIEALRLAYRRVRDLHLFHTIAICVLPDHLHAIWQLPQDDADFALRWRMIKSGFSRQLAVDTRRSASKIRRREKGIWQRRYWEHQIRDGADLQRHVDYIHYNPVKHGHAEQVRDWPFSSFHPVRRIGPLPARLGWRRQVGRPFRRIAEFGIKAGAGIAGVQNRDVAGFAIEKLRTAKRKWCANIHR